jgi:hypothetical protein
MENTNSMDIYDVLDFKEKVRDDNMLYDFINAMTTMSFNKKSKDITIKKYLNKIPEDNYKILNSKKISIHDYLTKEEVAELYKNQN